MKKVISVQTVKDAHKSGQDSIFAPKPDFIITPEARTVARDLGIQVVDRLSAQSRKNDERIDEELIRKIVSKIYNRLPDARNRPDEVKKAVIDILSGYIR